MNVLVLGKGGREHALVRALSFSQKVAEVHCAPGSQGMLRDSFIHTNLNPLDFDALVKFVREKDIELVVVGPEAYLVEGVTDKLKKEGVKVFGPSKKGAALENSKIFAKQFMAAAGIPTSHFEVVSSVEQTLEAAKNFTPPYVFKVDGLAAGKGVAICKNLEELDQAAKDSFVNKKFGESGNQALLEQFQKGYEISFLILTNGKEYQAMPLAQDHKSLLEQGKGPNTGGMGVVAPLNIDIQLEKQIHETILKPTVTKLHQDKIDYKGVVFIGLMITEDGPKVIEYNVRFGDPETQTILPLLDGDWGEVLYDIASGQIKPLKWKNQHITCVVLAAENYPNSPVKDVVIEGSLSEEGPFNYILHAGTKQNDEGDWVTNGGRVLNLIGVGQDPHESISNAYAMTKTINWTGMQFRKDIGDKLKV